MIIDLEKREQVSALVFRWSDLYPFGEIYGEISKTRLFLENVCGLGQLRLLLNSPIHLLGRNALECGTYAFFLIKQHRSSSGGIIYNNFFGAQSPCIRMDSLEIRLQVALED